jgi:2,3-bisphosphoglycerate-independent phosphoglycerate mutase
VAHYPAAIISGSSKKDSANYTLIGTGSAEAQTDSLSKIISEHNFKQIKIAETEKFALISNFFDNTTAPFPGEDYDLVPSVVKEGSSINIKMATAAVVKRLEQALKSDQHDFIVLSLANIDSVSHTGDFKKTVQAVEYIDQSLKKIVQSVLNHQGILLITSSHGYAEQVFDLQTDLLTVENTDNPVPFIIVGAEYAGKTIGLDEAPANDLSLLEPIGSLLDISPTVLHLFGLEIPQTMEGKSLV